MATYVVNFQSNGTETSPTIPGKANISLPKNTTNTTATSLTLTGQGVALYGEIQQENFIRLLENFASKTAPLYPTVGQLWFDTTVNKIKVYDINQFWYEVGNALTVSDTEPPGSAPGRLWYNTTEGILYLSIDATSPYYNQAQRYFGEWVQIWPMPTTYGSILEYNTHATRINKVIGTPSTSGTDPDVAMNQWGWGETDTLPIFTAPNTPTQFDNRAWNTLLARLMKATLHVDQSAAPVGNIPVYGFRSDGRGANATATAYKPSVTWTNGWGGAGIPTMNTRWADFETAVTALENNRFTINTNDTTWTLINTTSRPSWNVTKVYEAVIQFGSQANAKRFFNAAGQLRFNLSITGASNALTASWQQLLTNNGTNVNDYTTAGFVIDWKGSKKGPTGSYLNGGTSVGYYDLTTTYQSIYTEARPGAYGAGNLLFEAKTSTSGGWTVDVRITFTEDFNAGSSISGTTSVALQVRTPTGVVSGDPTVNTPSIAVPTVITQGTFVTAPAE